MLHAEDAGDKSFLVIRHLSIDTAKNDRALYLHGFDGIHEGGGVAFHIHMRFVAHKEHQTLISYFGVIEFVAARLQRFRVAVLVPHHRAQHVLRAGQLEQVEAIRHDLTDLVGVELLP